MGHTRSMPDLDGEIDDTSANGVVREDTDETPYPWDCDADYPEDVGAEDDDEDGDEGDDDEGDE